MPLIVQFVTVFAGSYMVPSVYVVTSDLSEFTDLVHFQHAVLFSRVFYLCFRVRVSCYYFHLGKEIFVGCIVTVKCTVHSV